MKKTTSHQDHTQQDITTDRPIKKSNSKVWMIVLAVLFVILIAVSTYGFMSVQKLNKQLKDQQTQINELQDKKKTLEDAASAAAAAAVKTAASAADSKSFIEVKELGFKLPLSDDIRNLNYFVNDNTAYFSTRELQAIAKKADTGLKLFCAPADIPLGVITKFANSADAGPTQQKNLGTFVLGYAPPQATCSNNAAADEMQTKQKNALIKAFNDAQKL